MNLLSVETIHEYPLPDLMDGYTEFEWTLFTYPGDCPETTDTDPVTGETVYSTDKHAVASSIEVTVVDKKSTSTSVPEYLLNTYSDRIYGDIMITLFEDPPHDNDTSLCAGLKLVDPQPTNIRNITKVDFDGQVIQVHTTDPAHATIMTSDVDLFIEKACPFAQGYEYYDNTTANKFAPKTAITDGGTENNIFVLVTEEDGSTVKYTIDIC